MKRLSNSWSCNQWQFHAKMMEFVVSLAMQCGRPQATDFLFILGTVIFFILGTIISYLIYNKATLSRRESHPSSLIIWIRSLDFLTKIILFPIFCSLHYNTFNSSLMIPNILFIRRRFYLELRCRLNVKSKD